MAHRLARGVLCNLLRRISCAFAGTFESDPASARPADDMPLHVRDAHESVVESSQYVGNANEDILSAFGLDDLFAGQIVGQ